MLYQNSDSGEDVHICFRCINDIFLQQTAIEDGEKVICSYCKELGPSVTLRDLADQIHDVLQEQFYMTSSEPDGIDYQLSKEGLWEQPGELVVNVISDIAGIDQNIAEDIQSFLSDEHGSTSYMDGGEDPYSDDAQYEEKRPDTLDFHDTWESFCQQLRHRSRFFSKHSSIDLDNIFGDLDGLKTAKGEPVILTAPCDGTHPLYRARVAISHLELEEMLKYPARELGAPPPHLAKSGRMNPTGISVFYGAADADTCIAEIRPSVGNSVVVGRFLPLRPLRLLNLNALADVYAQGSYFDPTFRVLQARATF